MWTVTIATKRLVAVVAKRAKAAWPAFAAQPLVERCAAQLAFTKSQTMGGPTPIDVVDSQEFVMRFSTARAIGAVMLQDLLSQVARGPIARGEKISAMLQVILGMFRAPLRRLFCVTWTAAAAIRRPTSYYWAIAVDAIRVVVFLPQSRISLDSSKNSIFVQAIEDSRGSATYFLGQFTNRARFVGFHQPFSIVQDWKTSFSTRHRGLLEYLLSNYTLISECLQ